MGNELSCPVEKIVRAAEGTSGGMEMRAAMFCMRGCHCVDKFRDALKSCKYNDGRRRSTPACRRAAEALRGCLQAKVEFYKGWDARERDFE